MKKIFILLTSMFLLVGCIESIALISGGATNGRMVQSSLQSGVSYVIKKQTGKTPLGHTISYVNKKNNSKKQEPCSFFDNKKDMKICSMVKERVASNQSRKEERNFSKKSSEDTFLSLQSSINKKAKIKYLD
jgi:hypothetical protein